MERMTLIERILWATNQKGWSQARLEREAELSKGYLSTAKKRGAEIMAPDSLAKIASLTGVDYTWLSTGRGEPIRAAIAPTSIEAPPIDLSRFNLTEEEKQVVHYALTTAKLSPEAIVSVFTTYYRSNADRLSEEDLLGAFRIADRRLRTKAMAAIDDTRESFQRFDEIKR